MAREDFDYGRLLSVKELVLTPGDVQGRLDKLQSQVKDCFTEIEEVIEELKAINHKEGLNSERRNLRRQQSMCYARIAQIRWQIAYMAAYFGDLKVSEYQREINEIYQLYYPLTPGVKWFGSRYKLYKDLAITLTGNFKPDEL